MQLHYLIEEVVMPISVFEVESTLTDRYQTTVPEPVRRALRLSKRDKIHYTIQADGSVVLTRVRVVVEEESDPAIDAFLQFLEQDMGQNPGRLSAIPPTLLARVERLTAGMEVDLDAPLSDEDEE
jgi:antitoxin PrlF